MSSSTGKAEPGSPGTVIRALADPLRARIVELLAGEMLCTCHLVELTGAGQTNVSNHLRVLREAGLIEAEPAGRYTYYRLCPEALAALTALYADLADRARTAGQTRSPCARALTEIPRPPYPMQPCRRLWRPPQRTR